MPELTLLQVKAKHAEDFVIKGVDLHLKDKEIGCLLGPSGCGKTTLLRAIAGLHNIDDGEIHLGKNCLSSLAQNIATEKRQIGMVFQDYALFPHMTIYDNIAFGLKTGSNKEKQARIQQLLELIDLPDVAKRYPHQLSGGQQQRIALARALAPKPSLLLMDEPFSGLDIELRESLAREVRDILKTEGIGALMVTHNQNEAFAMTDSIGVLK